MRRQIEFPARWLQPAGGAKGTKAPGPRAEGPCPSGQAPHSLDQDDRRVTAKLVKAIPAGAHLLLVGDARQLPSVGAGEVLRDLLAAGTLPRVRLTQIFAKPASQSGIVVTPTASTTASTRSSPASATFTGPPASLPGTPACTRRRRPRSRAGNLR